MNLKELKKIGAFVSQELTEVPVEWNGNKFTVHVRRIPFGDTEFIASKGADDGSQYAATLSKAIFLPDEGRLMSYEEAFSLDWSLAKVLIKAVTKSAGLDSPKP